jgi:hypothetical protein
MTRQWSFRVLAGLSVSAAVLVGSISASATTSLPWYSGMRAFGQSTVEPAVNDANGSETFLLTPNNAPSNANAAHASAPLYLVLYPDASTVSAGVLNCTPTNCNHAQIPGIKGHDHLVGIANTGGDYNVKWHVVGVGFTPQGVGDGAMNTRILTLSALNAAILAGDVVTFEIGPNGTPFYFNCSAVSATTYQKATPLNF